MTDVRRTVPFVDLGPATAAVAAPVAQAMAALMAKSAFVNGEVVAAFEHEFASFVGRSRCVGVASGLDALRLGLLALDLEPGDEVIVPAMTFAATFEAVVQAGAQPVVVDVGAEDCCIDVGAAAAAIGPRARVLMPVHLYGQMADMRALSELARRRGLAVVSDACQAHGARRDGIGSGEACTAAAYSFYPAKNLGAMGDAGALVLDDEDIEARVRALREHGQTQRYRSKFVGYTARLDALQALVLSHKLPHLDAWNEARRSAAAYYAAALSGVGDLRLPLAVEGSEHVWHIYAVRTADPDSLAAYLAQRGISTGRHYPEPPHLSEAFADLGYREGAFPNAEAIARETISLPLYPGIEEAQLEAVVHVIRGYFDGV